MINVQKPMLISDKLIYLELPKTACSHIRDLLQLLIGGEIIGKHNRPPNYLLQKNDKFIVGSIRNPWDWYVSLWAFGCDGKGSLYSRLTSKKLNKKGLISFKELNTINAFSLPIFVRIILENYRKNINLYKEIYSDSKNPQKFRQWLKLILELTSDTKFYLGDGYPFSSISTFAGFYTYYYIRLFAENFADVYTKRFENTEELRKFDQDNNILHDVIRVEALESDLVKIINKIGYNVDWSDLELISTFKPNWHSNKNSKTNSSSRNKKYQYYYDSESIELVSRREKFMIQKYGYTFS